MLNSKYIFKNKAIYNFRILFLKIFLVQVGLGLLSSTNGIINGIMSGNLLGTSSLAAIGFVAPLTNLPNFVFNLFSLGSVVLIGNQLGKQQNKNANGTYTLTIICLIVVGLFICILLFVFSEKISIILGAKDETIQESTLYLKGMCFGYPIMALNIFLNSLYTYDYKISIPLAAAITNIICNLFSVYLFVAILNLSIFFVGLSFSICQIAMLFIFLPHFCSKKSMFKIDFSKIKLDYLTNIIVKGFPAASPLLFLLIKPIVVNLLLSNFVGQYALSGVAIEESIATLIGSIAVSCGNTVLSVNSYFYGSKDRVLLVNFSKAALTLGLIIECIIAILLTATAHSIVCIYTHDAMIHSFTISIIWAFALSQIFSVISTITIQTYQSQGFKIVLFLYFLDFVLVPIIFASCIIPINGKLGTSLSIYAGEIVTILFIYFYLAIKNKSLFINFFIWFTQSDIVDSSKNDVLYLCVAKQADIKLAQDSVKKFYQNNSSEYLEQKASLCIEEICKSIMAYRNKKPFIKTVINIKIVNSKDCNNLIFMDNSAIFNSDKYCKKYNKSEKYNHIDLELPSNISNCMKYQEIFKMNTLTVTI